ncbi:MAG: hypothetical protein KGI89_16810 [Euryarchaeota archaeon]|nr:hypothetical protein [Euryarchaeota archaeon]
MKLRTVTGNRYPVKCACAANCGTTIPAGEAVRVVIDMDTYRPRRSYIPEHSPDAGKWKGNGSAANPAPSNGGNGHAAGFTPASALPVPPPKAPEPPTLPFGPG